MRDICVLHKSIKFCIKSFYKKEKEKKSSFLNVHKSLLSQQK